MDPDRERRYPDVEAFAEDLHAVLQRRSIRARRLPPALRLWRWCQRHRVAATALATSLLGALALPGVFAFRERQSNALLSAANRIAEQSLATTLDVIYSNLVRVADDKLRFVPAADRVARESLAEAAAMYRQLLRQYPGHTRLQVDAGKAMSRYAETLLRHGQAEPAMAVLREALDWLGGERSDVPDQVRLTRAYLWLNLGGDLAALGRRDDAAACFVAGERDLAAVVDRPACRVDAERAQLQLLVRRATHFDQRREAAAMEPLLHEGLVLARRLHAARPGEPFDTRNLVEQLDLLATMLVEHKRVAEALPLLDEALALARSIPAEARIWPPPSLVVAEVLETIGTLHTAQRDLRAVPALKECLQLREAAAKDHPHDVEIRSELAAALHNLASLNFQQAQDDLAVERLQRALPLQRQVVAEMPEYRQGRDYLRNHLALLGRAQHRLGDAAGLRATAEELSRLDTDPQALWANAFQWLRLGELLAKQHPAPADLAAQQEQCWGTALDRLQAAERHGLDPGSRFTSELFAPLRGRAEFEALVQRLAQRRQQQQQQQQQDQPSPPTAAPGAAGGR